MRYRIKNWSEYQHYKDRCPPWIKLHHSLLTSEIWVIGSDQTRVLAIACMLLASRNVDNDGTFNADSEYIRRFAYLNTKPDFKQLIEYGFIELVQDASTMLARCNTETETEKKKSKKEKIAVAFILPDWINPNDWNLWIKTRKKKMQPEQMQSQVKKLEKWKEAGLDYASALHESAVNGWQGLFNPSRDSKPNMPQSSGKAYHEKITDTLSQVFGDLNHGNKHQTIDITPEETDRSGTENLPEVRAGFR